MRRRDFFRFMGASAAAVTATAVPAVSDARIFPTAPINRTRLASAYPPAAPAVAQGFAELLVWLLDHRWREPLRRAAGFDLEAAISGGDDLLFAEVSIVPSQAAREFGGKRAIQPGDPAMSLLYHILAASDAQFPELSASDYPSDAQIDALENYIYDRTILPDDHGLELAVFAYEYRQAFKTPHRRHADMVFARAGISRTGTHECEYDPVLREYGASSHVPETTQSCATVSARFGLFLARRLPHSSIDRIAGNSADERYDFLLPVCKLVSGGRLIAGFGIQFQQSHRDEKLARLFDLVSDPAEGFDLSAPPFLRKSMSEDGVEGPRNLPGATSPLVTLRALRGSARVFPEARPVVTPARQNGRRARFMVPGDNGGPTSNRRYTSLKLNQDRLNEGVDAFFSDYLFRGGRPTTGFRTPRNGPAFVNIRTKIDINENGAERLTFLGRSDDHLDLIERGGYMAALFEDGLCDGCVTARIVPPTQDMGAAAIKLKDRKILPAISFVAAPDFFPRVDPLDLEDYDDMFLEGGTESGSGLRRPANPLVELPGEPGSSAFPIVARDRIAETMTAVVSSPAAEGREELAVGYVRSGSLNTLTDTVSNVFFPGWDITYSNEPDSGSSDTFLASFGLGSPFPEDMKLCAAANGMWAGASPDASRTFYPSLEPLIFKGRPTTAVPLLDEELGYHPLSPARAEFRERLADMAGWDGEYGPFVIIDPDANGVPHLYVDCADIMLSDYVQNAVEGRMDLGRMKSLHNRDVIDRMAMLATCIAALPRGGRVATTDMWLVSAEHVPDWGQGAAGLGVPRAMAARVDNRIAPAPGLEGAGFLYLFAHCPSPDDGSLTAEGRRRYPARRLYMCHGDGRFIHYVRLELGSDITRAVDWSRSHAIRYG